jgi:hypothetical protein
MTVIFAISISNLLRTVNFLYIIDKSENVMCKFVQAVTLLICIQDIPGWNLGQHTEYPD